MCGVEGGINSLEFLEKDPAKSIQNRRGPDSFSVFHHHEYSLSMYRLLFKGSLTEEIPFECECAFKTNWKIVFNGEIFNYRILQSDLKLKGHKFKNITSDGEVIAHAISEYGPSVFGQFRGMFAIAALSLEDDVLYLARDYFGKKPLGYILNSESLIFSSRIDEFISTKCKPKIDKQFLASYLHLGYCVWDSTPFVNAINIAPAEVMEIKRNKLNTLHIKSTKFKIATNTSNSSFKEIFSQSIEKRIEGDYPLSIFLSGGIDSALVAATLAQEFGIKPVAFTFSQSNIDESEYDRAKLVSKKLGLDHIPVFDSLDKNDFYEMIFALDQPISDSSMLPMMLVSRRIKENGFKLAFSGDGADELFCGYERYALARDKNSITTSTRLLKENLNLNYLFSRRHLYLPFLKAHFRNKDLFDVYEFYIANFRSKDLKSISTPLLDTEIDLHLKGLRDKFKNGNNLLQISNQLQEFDMRTYLSGQILPKIDRAAMHYSIEVRSPFLDEDLANFALHLSDDDKFSQSHMKLLLRNHCVNYFGKEFAFGKKTGFSFSLFEYMNRYLAEEIDTLPESVKKSELNYYINQEFVRGIVYKFKTEQKYSQQVWSLLVLEKWLASKL
jgi:asparagine synthase (glutamine-hydrolysing)